MIATPRPVSAAARSTEITFVNHTSNTLIKVRQDLSHGEWTTEPPDTIYAGTTIRWRSESNGVLTGTEGWVRYRLQSRTPPPYIPDSDTFYIHWDNPYSGSNSYDVATPSPDFTFTQDGGSGNDAFVTFTLNALVAGLLDSDGDGIPDDWEKNGVNVQPNGTGVPVFVDLPRMGADPNKPDIFLQTDWMQDAKHNEQLDSQAILAIVRAFAISPYVSPTGSKGINLHIDNGPNSILNFRTGAIWGSLSRARAIPWSSQVGSLDDNGNFDWTNFQSIKDNRFTETGRTGFFHYAIVAYSIAGEGFRFRGLSRNYDDVSTGASDIVLGLRGYNDFSTQSIALMHELGHNLGLDHGGGDPINFKPNYLSIMNYAFSDGLLIDSTTGHLDYSREELLPLDKSNLDESIGLSGVSDDYGTMYYCLGFGFFPITQANRPIDWNCEGPSNEVGVSADINGSEVCVSGGDDEALTSIASGDDEVYKNDILDGADTVCDTTASRRDVQLHDVGSGRARTHVLRGFNDWANLKFNGGAIGAAGASLSLPLRTKPETDTPELINQLRAAFRPRTTLSFTGGKAGQNGWLVTPVLITLSAQDSSLGKGIDFTEYSLDGQNWVRYTAPFTLPEGKITVWYRSQDKVGNLEDTKQQIFNIDTLAPTSSLTVGLPQYSSGPLPVIPSITPLTLMASDATSGVQSVAYRFFRQGSSPPAYTTQNSDSVQFTLDGPDGLYEVDSFSTDIAGNTELPHVLSVRLSNTRVINGLQALYTFEEGSGAIVHDVSGNGAALDLSVSNPTAVHWVSGGLVISSTTMITSALSATKLTAAISATGEFTFEGWVRTTDNNSRTSGNIAALATDSNNLNFTLAQALADEDDGDHYEAQLRTSSTSLNGKILRSRDGSLTTDLTHIVYTHDALGTSRLYINGIEQAKRTITGDFSNWGSDARLVLANTLTGDHPWLGEYQLVAFYNRALSPAEVNQNLIAGSSGGGERLTTGLQALYNFGENGGLIVHNAAGTGAPLDLMIGDPSAVHWVPEGLVISTTTMLATTTSAISLTNSISKTGELTLEAWIVPADTHQQTLARIVTLSDDNVRRNVELIQERREDEEAARYTARLRSTMTGGNGMPPLKTPDGTALPRLQHVAYTRDAYGRTRLYIDGKQQAEAISSGNLSNWDASYHLTLANTLQGDRPWLGEYRLVAIYNRALGPTEVRQNYRSGPQGDQLPPTAPKLQALYPFDEGSGTTVHDRAISDTPIDLQITDTSAAHWTVGGLSLGAPTTISSTDPARRLTNAARISNEISIEAWVIPAAAQKAHLLTLTNDTSQSNVALLQDGLSAASARYGGRLQTSTTQPDGALALTPKGSVVPTLTHLVYSRDALGVVRLYINGVVQTKRTITGDFSNWDTQAHLVLGSRLDGSQSWMGEYQLVAFYNRALSPAEIRRHFQAGPDATPRQQ